MWTENWIAFIIFKIETKIKNLLENLTIEFKIF